MEEVVNELLDKLEESGFECSATKAEMPCCGDLYMVDYNYNIDSEKYFRILIKPGTIEISKLLFSNIMISFASFKSAQQVLETINHCKKIDNY